ncbi:MULTISPECIES: hypothetical protein [Enterobacteriaceae]|jgi:hypothetical protein|uniref:Uncharacterized protein n=3 Tax=Enterobacteriaceae TaxID=543 RepID=A0A483H2X4_KLEPN|nr:MULTISPECIES: hypothetical protein [Enterobacteriaceae]EFJ8047022.1 hypothetical protein [Escherichia coli]QLW88882.1 hypothetical protein HV175_09940 [Klebsiella oxytoca]HCM3155633.1 hypothetical protein [Klebsiella quasipneumoniae subsp. similipneumoniae]HDR2749919.1 hypothetical protein [Enterobacter asburiae]HDU5112026.1 hypothetical protein [Klebsiella pneumoniae subsp. ozaenae]HDV8378549.1 hypothetical protein [Citrobacter freundii]
MNKKILVLSVVLGFSAMSNASEPKYAFPQSDKPVISKIKIKNAPVDSEKYGHGEVLANGMWVKGNTANHKN